VPTAELTIELDGSRALESNASQHGGDPKSFRVFKDLVTDVANRIVKRDGKGATLGSVAGTEIQLFTNTCTSIRRPARRRITRSAQSTAVDTSTAGTARRRGRRRRCRSRRRQAGAGSSERRQPRLRLQRQGCAPRRHPDGTDDDHMAHGGRRRAVIRSDVFAHREQHAGQRHHDRADASRHARIADRHRIRRRVHDRRRVGRQAHVINGYAYTIQSVTSTTVLILTEAFKEATARGTRRGRSIPASATGATSRRNIRSPTTTRRPATCRTLRRRSSGHGNRISSGEPSRSRSPEAPRTRPRTTTATRRFRFSHPQKTRHPRSDQ
jgi:hypothetical protein